MCMTSSRVVIAHFRKKKVTSALTGSNLWIFAQRDDGTASGLTRLSDHILSHAAIKTDYWNIWCNQKYTYNTHYVLAIFWKRQWQSLVSSIYSLCMAGMYRLITTYSILHKTTELFHIVRFINSEAFMVWFMSRWFLYCFIFSSFLCLSFSFVQSAMSTTFLG